MAKTNFRIVPKRDFGKGRGFYIKGQYVKRGFIVTDGICNIMPGATWFQTVEEAMRAIEILGAKNSELVVAMTRILPDGDLIGWKKCMQGVIVKLRIPEAAKRSHAFGRKCRAEYADVIEVIGAEVGIAKHDEKTEYRAGQRMTPDSFDENWQEECSNGIHFFITREEAEAY